MGEYDSPARRLPYPLDHSSAIQRTTEDDVDCESSSSFVWPEDPDERTLVPFLLSQREYTVLSSAVDAGSDIAYSEDAIRVWWLWVRNMRCDVAICSMIIDCLMTDPDTRESIVNMLLNNPDFIDGIRDVIGGRQPVNPGEIVLPIVESCDKDVLFGAITSVIDGMHRNNTDANEIMEQATNDEERIPLIIEAIPGLSEITPTELIDLAQQLVENFGENYDAEWTTELYDEIRMDLLCIAEKKCQITIGMIYDYFSGRIGGSLTIGTAFTDAITFLATGDWPGTHIVDFMFMMQIVAIRGGSQYFGVTLYSIELQAALGENNPNSDWELLEPGDCPDEETDCIEYDYDVRDNPTVGHDTGIYVRKGQTVKITATGTFKSYPGGPDMNCNGGTDGSTPAGANYVAPDLVPNSRIYRIGGNPWEQLDPAVADVACEKEFVSEFDGKLSTGANTYLYLGGPADSVGTIHFEVCVEPLPIVLQKTSDAYKLKLISENDGEPIYEVETITTGHAVVFSSIEINGTHFYIKHIQVLTPESQYFSQLGSTGSIGLGIGGVQAWWRYNNMPADFVSSVLAMQGVGPGLKLRFTLTTVPGETGELVPYAIGAIP